MRTSLLKNIAIAAMLTFSVTSYAIEPDDSVRHAADVIKGIVDNGNKPDAINVLRQAAEEDTCVFAMNVLGIAYMNGFGVDKDTALAVRWLEQAGEYGSNTAYNNLGMMYKYSHGGVRQDFARACRYFEKAISAGSVSALYNMGYMLYKGLGCRQSYEQAMELFRRGADKDHAPCLYMLGLCYRNGYGTEKDNERAACYLERAAMLNYHAATEELRREKAENSWNDMSVEVEQSLGVPETMPAIAPAATDIETLPGTYQGIAVVYDWSGRYVIGEHPLAVDMRIEGELLKGFWCEGRDTVEFCASVSDDGRLTFHSGMMKRKDRYVVKDSVAFRFENAEINIGECSITGSLRLYSMSEREPERPMYICLYKDNGDSIDSTGTQERTRLYAWPNPFSGQITLSFELTESAPNARMALYSQSGMNVFTSYLGLLPVGKHSFTISPDVVDGIYVLHVTAGKHTFRTIIVKKR